MPMNCTLEFARINSMPPGDEKVAAILTYEMNCGTYTGTDAESGGAHHYPPPE